jgi:hypothetical protein
VGDEHLLGRLADERRAAREHLVRHRADGVEVGAMVERRVGAGLLGRHVGRRAERHADARRLVLARRLAHRLGHAEVGDQRVPLGQHHVVGLDVAMHHAATVRMGQRIGDLDEQPHGLADGERAITRQPLPQRLAVHERHDIVEEAGTAVGLRHLARIEQRQHMRMAQLGRDLDLAQEALRPERGGQLGPQHLHRHPPPVFQVLGQVHGRHPTGAYLALKAVPVGQRFSERLWCLGHAISASKGGTWTEA